MIFSTIFLTFLAKGTWASSKIDYVTAINYKIDRLLELTNAQKR